MDFPKFNFVINCSDAALIAYTAMKMADLTRIDARGDISWCLQSYIILSEKTNLPVTCSNRLFKDSINIVHSDQLVALKGTSDYFIVCVQGDYPPRQWAHYHIVQNKNQLRSHTSVVPFWITPGLTKRDPHRTGVSRVGYSGHLDNGNLASTEDTWKQLFSPYAIEFVTLSNANWHNLSTIDVLMGIRSFDTQPHNTKPPSKLINAWHAQIPFIGGHDSAYKQVGVPGKDYLLAGTAEEVVQAVLQLQNDPGLYSELVQNGIIKATQFSEQTIIERWVKILTGPVFQRYLLWKSRPFFERVRFSILLSLGLAKHAAKQRIKKIFKPGDIVLPNMLFIRQVRAWRRFLQIAITSFTVQYLAEVVGEYASL